jgi:hypothetical protein
VREGEAGGVGRGRAGEAPSATEAKGGEGRTRSCAGSHARRPEACGSAGVEAQGSALPWRGVEAKREMECGTRG